MSQLHTTETRHTDITRILAENSMGIAFDALPKDVVERAKHCLIDWLGVTLAGSIEPLAQILIEQAMAEGGGEHATIVGDGRKTSLGQAALINGSASHALDFDDVQSNMHGHPSVPVFPAVLAIAEKDGLAGKDVLAAVLLGGRVSRRSILSVVAGLAWRYRGALLFDDSISSSAILCLE